MNREATVESSSRAESAPRSVVDAAAPASAGQAGPATGSSFYTRLVPFDGFARLSDPSIYAPLPDDWVLGLSDIVSSTAAIEAGRYKTVNTAAAAVIAAVANALHDTDFPFVFGGDGASFALPSDQAEKGRVALASVATWVRDELDLQLRIALVPVEAVREAGFDVRVARFAPSPDVTYAMFTGGGLAWAEGQMKAGSFAVAPAPSGTLPDLRGLSCRFSEIKATRGVILSMIVLPAPGADPAGFRALIEDVLALVESDEEAGRPVPAGGPPIRWPPAGFDLEAKARRAPGQSRFVTRISLAIRTFLAYLVFRTGLRVGSFDPSRYLHQLVRNTDFRKFDDGLRMTLDATPQLADRIDERLAKAERSGIAQSGTHRQETALMTCFVPSPTHSDHVHFVDGAMGGYAAAARAVKQARADTRA
jgi:hypothetical protein